MADDRQPFATVDDMTALWRPMSVAETARAQALLPVVSDMLRQEAKNRGYDLDEMLASGDIYDTVLKGVTVDVTARSLLTSTEAEPLTQESQSALGYSWSGTYFNAGGGIFIKNSELARLGLHRQKMGVIEIYDTYPRRYSHSTETD